MQNVKRVMLVGESKTGKTSIISYLLKNRQYEPEHYPTVGVEAGIKTIEYGQGRFAAVQIWDTAGKHELHEYVCEKFYGDIDGFLIVISLADENTLASVKFWSQKIKSIRRSNGKFTIGVFASKADQKRQFDEQKFRAMHPSISFYREFSLKDAKETSGKALTQVEASFYDFVVSLYGEENLPTKAVISAETQEDSAPCSCALM